MNTDPDASSGGCGADCACDRTAPCCKESPSERTAGDGPAATGMDHETAPMPNLGFTWTLHDLDEEWEDDARAHLADVEFDTDLGVELARDAMRLARGELTAEAFQERHHDAVMAEFGVDARSVQRVSEIPQNGDDGDAPVDTDRPLPGVPSLGRDGDASRRSVLKSMGALAAGSATVGLAGCVGQSTGPLSADGAARAADPDIQMGMVIDMERCIACLKCVEGCKEENDTDRGTHWMHVFRYEEDEYGEVEEGYMPRPCQHCSEPSCQYVCPTQARYKRGKDGLVLTNYDTCIGCKYCQVACPYGVNFLGKGEPTDKSPGFFGSAEDETGTTVGGPPPVGVMGKCTFCVHRQDDPAQQGTTACEDACPVDAIHFGDLDDPESNPRRHLREKHGTSRFKLLDNVGNEPNVHYIGQKPSKDATPTDGPFAYEDLGMEKLADPRGDSK